MPASHETLPPAGETVIRGVRRALDDAGVPLTGRGVLAMCSGGIDSVCLVDVLASLPRGARPAVLEVAFLDHGTRDVSGDREAALEIASFHGLVMHERSTMGLPMANLQADAREWRYAEAAELARARGLDTIATGHTADDQLETVLGGLISGGPGALAGMPLERDLDDRIRLVRPLLAVNRVNIVEWTRARSLQWAEDPSNALPRFRRNRLRAEVIPQLLAIAPHAGRNVERLRRRVAMQDRAVTELAADWLALHAEADLIPCESLRELGGAARSCVLAQWLEDLGLGRSVTERAVRAVDELVAGTSQTALVWVRGGKIWREGDVLRASMGDGADLGPDLGLAEPPA